MTGDVTWPRCPTCSEPYSVTLGLPVVLTGGGIGRFVDAEIDLEVALDEDATLSCNCGTSDDDEGGWSEEQYDAAVEALQPAVDALIRSDRVTATYDLRTGA